MFSAIYISLLISTVALTLVISFAKDGYAGNIKQPLLRLIAVILMTPVALLLVILMCLGEAFLTRDKRPLRELVEDLKRFPSLLIEALKGR